LTAFLLPTNDGPPWWTIVDQKQRDSWRAFLLSKRKSAIAFEERVGPPQPLSEFGNSFGGFPRLPPDAVWPVSAFSGLPMHFLAEIDLSSLPDFEDRALLPAEGALYFFICTGKNERARDFTCKVLWLPTRPQLHEQHMLAGDYLKNFEPPYYVGFRHKTRVTPRPMWTLSPTEPPEFLPDRDKVPLAVRRAYFQLKEEVEGNDSYQPERLLGYAFFAHEELNRQAGRLSLLQLRSTRDDPDDKKGIGWKWGDMGWLSFSIAPADLAARHFDKAVLTPIFHDGTRGGW
jgi:uncharacterized protein YwqG